MLYYNKTALAPFDLAHPVYCYLVTCQTRRLRRALGGVHVPPTKAKIRKLSKFDAP